VTTSRTTWLAAEATVVSSEYHYARFRDLDHESFGDHSYFLVGFCYEVSGRTFSGFFEQHEETDPAKSSTFLYDSVHPERYSLGVPNRSRLPKILAWAFGLAFGLLLVVLWQHLGLPGD
jgi:hypothetical protein